MRRMNTNHNEQTITMQRTNLQSTESALHELLCDRYRTPEQYAETRTNRMVLAWTELAMENGATRTTVLAGRRSQMGFRR